LELEHAIEGWPTHAPSSPIEPRLLVTFTMRAAGAVSSQGRKAQRGLVERQPSDGAVTVHLTPAGRAVLAEAAPVHASAVRCHLLSRLTAEQQRAVVALAQEDSAGNGGYPVNDAQL
jgi:hypothetical protein